MTWCAPRLVVTAMEDLLAYAPGNRVVICMDAADPNVIWVKNKDARQKVKCRFRSSAKKGRSAETRILIEADVPERQLKYLHKEVADWSYQLDERFLVHEQNAFMACLLDEKEKSAFEDALAAVVRQVDVDSDDEGTPMRELGVQHVDNVLFVECPSVKGKITIEEDSIRRALLVMGGDDYVDMELYYPLNVLVGRRIKSDVNLVLILVIKPAYEMGGEVEEDDVSDGENGGGKDGEQGGQPREDDRLVVGLPGGHRRLGERMKNAGVREFAHDTGVSVPVGCMSAIKDISDTARILLRTPQQKQDTVEFVHPHRFHADASLFSNPQYIGVEDEKGGSTITRSRMVDAQSRSVVPGT